MPIHLIWGNDTSAIERQIDSLIKKIIDPSWITMNLSRLDGSEIKEASKALQEARTPPLGNGGRMVILKNSPFCNGCQKELIHIFEELPKSIPEETHLLLLNLNKPDGRLKTTKTLKSLINSKLVIEKSFLLPTIWDGNGKKELVINTAKEFGIELHEDAISYLIEAIGNDSERLSSELKKISLHSDIEINSGKSFLVTEAIAKKFVKGLSTNALQIGEFLLNESIVEAIYHIETIITNGEPPLRLLAALTGQVRGWLWISLLTEKGETNVDVIAKAAGISNPKRIYVMRKQLQGKSAKQLLNLLSQLLRIEAELKHGAIPTNAFRDALLNSDSLLKHSMKHFSS